ncbi:interferon-related developmental regulator 2 isoform X3 [Lathamus discolor]|uniref:interferon-related developmental regulator 2 isoform X3 n=1 Tax=Lathamus discolor TaxID=678569 RepID=UPI0032B7D153
MPRFRRAMCRGPSSRHAGSPASEEETGSEVLSHCSSASEGGSPAEEPTAPGRGWWHCRACAWPSPPEPSPSSCRSAASRSLTRCRSASRKMGSGPEGEEVFRSVKPLLISILTDSEASPGARQSCATALGMCCYIAAADLEDLVSCLSCLESIFSPPSTPEGGSAPSQHGPLHCSALQSWSLLLTICPPSHIKSVLDNGWLRLPPLLASSNVELRILAGETVALVFELAQAMEVDLCHQDTVFLCDQLKVLATESNKYRAKMDRRKQRSIFRDILHFIESGEYQEETICFGLECMYLDSWACQRTYQAFKEVLSSGINHHLQNNELLREIFSLGPPLVLDAAALKASKVSRFEKHLYNSAAFKARTKARSRVRDKRADVL